MYEYIERDIRVQFGDLDLLHDFESPPIMEAGHGWVVRCDDLKTHMSRGKNPPTSVDLALLPLNHPWMLVELKDPSDPTHPNARIQGEAMVRDLLRDGSDSARDEESGVPGVKCKLLKKLALPYCSSLTMINQLVSRDLLYPFVVMLCLDGLPMFRPRRVLGVIRDSIRRELGKMAELHAVPDVAVLDLAGWNRQFPQYPATRLSEAGGQA